MKSSAGRSKAGKGDEAGGGAAKAASPRDSSPAPSRAGKGVARGRAGGRVSPMGLLEALSRGEFPASIYLDGDCEPVKAALLAELRSAWGIAVPQSPLANVFRAAEAGVEQLLAAWQGASLFSPRDLVIVLDMEDWGRSEKKVLAFAEVLTGSPSPSTIVLVESAAENDRKLLEPLRAACRTHVKAERPDLPELVRWGERRFAREGFAIEDGALALLAETCEGDALAFFSELDKLCIWAARDRRLALSDVEALLRPVVGSELEDYLAAIAAGDTRRATQRLGRLLLAGAGEGALMFSLSNIVGGALGGWAKNKAASETLRRRLHPVQLARAMDAIYRAEAAWKGGRADVVALLEQATRAVCAGS